MATPRFDEIEGEEIVAPSFDAIEGEELRADWGDAGARAAPGPRDASSVAPEQYGPEPRPAPPPDARHQPDAGESFVQGAANALGTGDLIGAVLQAGLSEATDLPALLSGKMGLKELQARRNAVFSSARQDNLSRTRKAMQEHPGATIAGRMAPSLLMAPVTGAANTLAASAGVGALTGAVEGAAQSEADTVGGVLADTGTGAAAGGIGGALGYGAGRYVLGPVGAWVGSKAGQALSRGSTDIRDALRRWAAERALKATGYIQKDFPKAAAKRAALLQRGTRLLNEPGLITPGASTGTIRDRLEPLVEESGERISKFLADVDSTAPVVASGAGDDAVLAVTRHAGLEGGSGGFNAFAFIDKVEREVLAPALEDPSLSSQASRIATWLNDMRRTAIEREASGRGFPFALANQMKGNLQAGIFDNKGDVLKNKALANDMQRLFIEAIDEQAEPLMGEAAVQGFQGARRDYGTFKEAYRRATEGENRQVGNDFLGLSDRLAAETAAAAGGGIPGAAAAAGANKALRGGRMDSTMARAASNLAESRAMNALMSTSPEVVGGYGAAVGGVTGQVIADVLGAQQERGMSDGELVEDLARNNPEALGPYATTLQQAAAEGRLPVVHYVLMQRDQNYRQMLQEARQGGQ